MIYRPQPLPILLILLLAMLGGCGLQPNRAPTPPPTATPPPTPRPTATAIPTPTPRPGTLRTRPSDGMAGVYVPAGSFTMGSSDAEIVRVLESCAGCQRDWFIDERPAHEVYLKAFWIDQTEVTNAQFVVFLNQRDNQVQDGVTWLDLDMGSSMIEQSGALFQVKDGYAGHPVTGVSWHGAAAYCQWAGARLPSEAEWEYAARGPDGRIYPWGNEFDCAGGNLNTACDDGYAGTAPVGSFPNGASWCEALDMSGNVAEWVADPYDATYYERSPDWNPTGPGPGAYRVLRGGAWNVGAWAGRGAHRDWNLPPDRSMFVGFRCAASAGE